MTRAKTFPSSGRELLPEKSWGASLNRVRGPIVDAVFSKHNEEAYLLASRASIELPRWHRILPTTGAVLERRTLSNEGKDVRYVLCPSGKALLTTPFLRLLSLDGTTQWEYGKGFADAAFLCAGKYIVANDARGNLHFFDREQQQLWWTAKGLLPAAASRNEQFFASSVRAGTVQLLALRTGVSLATWNFPSDVSLTFLLVTDDGRVICVAKSERFARLFCLEQAHRKPVWKVDRLQTTAVAVAVECDPASDQLFLVYLDGVIEERVLSTGALVHEDKVPRRLELARIAPSCDRVLLCGFQWFSLWDLRARKELQFGVGHYSLVELLACSSKGDCVASGAADGCVYVWSASELPVWSFERDEVKTLSFSSDDRLLRADSQREYVAWDLRDGSSSVLEPLTETIIERWSARDERLSWRRTKQQDEWTLFDEEKKRTLFTTRASRDQLAFTDGGACALVLSRPPEKMELVWFLEEHHYQPLTQKIAQEPAWTYQCILTGDAKYLLLSVESLAYLVLDAHTLEPLRRFDPGVLIKATPHSKWLYGIRDTSLMVYHVPSFELAAECSFRSDEDHPCSVAFSADGSVLYVGTVLGRVYRYRLPVLG